MSMIRIRNRIFKRISLWTLVAAGLPLSACGGEPQAGDATAECNALAELACEHALGCLTKLGRLSRDDYEQEYDDCVRAVNRQASCDEAVEVSESYDACLEDLEAEPCSTWDVPESEDSFFFQEVTVIHADSCEGVILVGR